MLTLQGIFAGYGGGDVLQGVDLEVGAGTVTCIVGPNGAGKSTVLRVVSGLLRPRLGEVVLRGESLAKLSAAAVLGRGVAQVPQSHALFPHMSVKDNVLLGGYLIRRNSALLRQRLAAVEELVPVVRERNAVPAGNLSGGQRRMVEIARCLMLDPSVMLLDEPSLGLDPKSLGAVSDLVNRMRDMGKTVLMVEQNVRLGLGLASHGVVMEGGRVRLHGPAAEVAANPEIASMYLGAAPPSQQPADASVTPAPSPGPVPSPGH